jgi:hypothetical protein
VRYNEKNGRYLNFVCKVSGPMSEDTFVKIMDVPGYSEASQMVQILQSHGIPAFYRGGLQDVYMGSSMMGQDILVREKDAARAREILGEFQPVSFQTAYSRKGRSGKQKILFGIVLIVLIAAVVFSLLIFLLH